MEEYHGEIEDLVAYKQNSGKEAAIIGELKTKWTGVYLVESHTIDERNGDY